jgi:hypothetical protein
MAVFNSAVFNPAVYFTGDAAPARLPRPSDNEKRRKSIFKPLGLVDRPRKDGRKSVDDRIDESRVMQADIAAQLAREFSVEELPTESPPIERMSLADVDAEIGLRLRAKLKNEQIALIARQRAEEIVRKKKAEEEEIVQIMLAIALIV